MVEKAVSVLRRGTKLTNLEQLDSTLTVLVSILSTPVGRAIRSPSAQLSDKLDAQIKALRGLFADILGRPNFSGEPLRSVETILGRLGTMRVLAGKPLK